MSTISLSQSRNETPLDDSNQTAKQLVDHLKEATEQAKKLLEQGEQEADNLLKRTGPSTHRIITNITAIGLACASPFLYKRLTTSETYSKQGQWGQWGLKAIPALLPLSALALERAKPRTVDTYLDKAWNTCVAIKDYVKENPKTMILSTCSIVGGVALGVIIYKKSSSPIVLQSEEPKEQKQLSNPDTDQKSEGPKDEQAAIADAKQRESETSAPEQKAAEARSEENEQQPDASNNPQDKTEISIGQQAEMTQDDQKEKNIADTPSNSKAIEPLRSARNFLASLANFSNHPVKTVSAFAEQKIKDTLVSHLENRQVKAWFLEM